MNPLLICLVGINARHSHTCLSLRYLRQALALQEPTPTIYLQEFTINQPLLDMVERVVETAPDIVCFATYIWNSELVHSLVDDLSRLLPCTRLVLGGPEVAWSAQAWLERHPGIHLIVQGNAEAAAPLLAGSPQAWPASRIHAPLPMPFTQVPMPWEPSELAAMADRYLYYESSRGCPFACSYCLSSRSDQALDFKDLDQVFRELAILLTHEPMLVKFVDRTFNADPLRARQIWRWLLDWSHQHPPRLRQTRPDNPDNRRKHPVPEATRFHFEIQAALLEPRDFALLATVPPGIFQFELGIQTTRRATLDTIERPVPVEACLAAIRRLIDLGTIHVHVDMIVGLPGENMAAIAQSFDTILALGAQHFQMGFLKSLPGTPIHTQANERGMIFSNRPPYQLLASPWLSNQELARLRRVEKILDNLWPHVELRTFIHTLSTSTGGYLQAFLYLEQHARELDFDLNTRHEGKLRDFLVRCC